MIALIHFSVIIDITCHRVSAASNDEFSFKDWKGDGVQYVNSIVNGKYASGVLPYGP